MKLLTIFTIATLLTFSACNNTESVEHNHEAPEVAAKEQHDDHAGHETTKQEETLHLNNGKKWIANQATQDGMAKMQATLMEYFNNRGTDYAALAKTLDNETSSIIKQCDMTGQDHDQLHIILKQMLDKIKIIKENGSQDEMKRLYMLLNDYFDHFETAK